MDAPLSRELHSLLLLTLVAKPNLQKTGFRNTKCYAEKY